MGGIPGIAGGECGGRACKKGNIVIVLLKTTKRWID